MWYLNDKGGLEKLSCTLKNGLVTFDFDYLSLYVVGQDTAWVNPFADIKKTDWFYGVVQYACENDLMKGTGSAAFDPHGATTPGMIVTILCRLEKNPAVNATNLFADVAARADLFRFADAAAVSGYAKDAMDWANAGGLIQGSGTKILPTGRAVCAQVAPILQRFIETHK